MGFEHIEKLQREYTDKFVVVDDRRPELQRFKNMTGLVKTVNMSGRALVQFDVDTSIGWYDIDVDFLKVVDRPRGAGQGKGVVSSAALKSRNAPSALEMARGQKQQPTTGKRLATADVLAAARAAPEPAIKAPKSAAEQERADATAAPGKLSTAEILAAARGQAPAAKQAETKRAEAKQAERTPPAERPAGKTAPGKLSTAEILAAARGQTPAAKQAEPSRRRPSRRNRGLQTPNASAARNTRTNRRLAAGPNCRRRRPKSSPTAGETRKPPAVEPQSAHTHVRGMDRIENID